MSYFCQVEQFDDFVFFRDFNKFLFFSINVKVLSVLNFCFKTFISSKKFAFTIEKSYIKSIYSGFSFSDWYFYKNVNGKILSSASYLYLKKYKCTLKMLVKDFQYVSCSDLIKLLNIEVSRCSEKFGFLVSFAFVAQLLDFYLYKLIWKWCKRFHPRRPNFWIFDKYWKNISGTYKFYYKDILTGKFFFLNSHLSIGTSLKRLPVSMSVFDFRDRKKIYSDWFRKTRNKFKGIYGILFDIQRGLCPCCNRLLIYSNLQYLRILQIFSIRPKIFSCSHFNLVLVHDSCEVFY